MDGQQTKKTSTKTTVLLDGATYIWTGSSWFDSHYIKPPITIIQRLNAQLESQLADDDSKITDIYDLTHRAKIAREAKQYARAESLARRVLRLNPKSHAAAAVLCASLRACGRASQALEETDRFKHTENVPLLTSRAAALCDIGRWEEAKHTLGKALALGGGEEAFLVVKRIKRARPDLYRG
jgi:tetratricopeptide (TPR) repeat protein